MEDVRLRCHCEIDEDGCWHLRTGRHGRPIKRGETARIWVHGRGEISAVRAVWELAHGKRLAPHYVAYRTCDSHDCANPAHIKASPASVARREVMRRLCADRTVQQAAAARARHGRNPTLPPELRRWVAESHQSGVQLAHALGVSVYVVSRARIAQRRRMAALPWPPGQGAEAAPIEEGAEA